MTPHLKDIFMQNPNLLKFTHKYELQKKYYSIILWKFRVFTIKVTWIFLKYYITRYIHLNLNWIDQIYLHLSIWLLKSKRAAAVLQVHIRFENTNVCHRVVKLDDLHLLISYEITLNSRETHSSSVLRLAFFGFPAMFKI